jgi:hypothetical protein
MILKTLIAILTAATTALCIGWSSPAAHACCDSTPLPPTPQESQFIADMKNAGVTSRYGDSFIRSAGLMLCQAKWDYQDRGMGFPPSMISGIQASISYPDLNQIMALALQDLCPTRSDWGGRPYVGTI